MVGDTPTDVVMGQAANLGLTVGVETGVTDKEGLIQADIIVRSVEEVGDMFAPQKMDDEDAGRVVFPLVTSRGIGKIANWGRNSVQQGQN